MVHINGLSYSPFTGEEIIVYNDFTRCPYRKGLNNSRLIERHQIEDKAPKIGLRVYRCTYDDEESWGIFINALKSSAIRNFELDEAPDVAERFHWDIQDDESSLNRASIEAVRDLFKQWAADEIKKDGVSTTTYATRYNFCVYDDKGSVDSLIQALDSPWLKGAYVQVIAARRYVTGSEQVVTPTPFACLIPQTYCTLADLVGWEMICRERLWRPGD